MPCLGPLPQPGDLIEFSCIAFEHWGVCVGDGKFVHLVPDGLDTFPTAIGVVAVVKEEYFKASLHSILFSYKVNNKYDKRAVPYPPGKIVNAARREVGKKRSYDLLKANCEHFVTELRYGIPFCDQVDKEKIAETVGDRFRGTIAGAGDLVGRLFNW
ncbi:phospholipase A and acyltransferase 3-like [Phyllobates terribilis]|uniref:phospholipase A and acyltransferase 3-like n=1 Tax=Phyllobates terribilis TaxID=111132 RepID=UPI003CCA861E